MCRQEVHLKYSVGWDLIGGDVKGLNWKEIVSSPCPVSSLTKTLMCITRDRVSKRTIGVRTGDKPWFDDRCVLAHRVKPRVYRVWSSSTMQTDWEEYGMNRRHGQFVYVDAERVFTERSKSL